MKALAQQCKALHGQPESTETIHTGDCVLQVLNNLPVTYASDLWSLGCVVYQMLVGATPFKAATEYLTFQRISAGQMDVPAFVPAPAQDMLRKLLHPDATRRLGQLKLPHSG